MAVAHDDRRLRSALAWDGFIRLAGEQSGFMQTSWWADVLAEQDWGHFGAIFRDGSDILGGARILTSVFEPGRCFYYIPDGPILPEDPTAAEALHKAMMLYVDKKRQRQVETVTHLRIEPRWTERPPFLADWHEFNGWLEPRYTLLVDLRSSEAEILAQMKSKGRYNIKLASKRGVKVIEDTSLEGIESFLEIYGSTMQRKGTDLMDFNYLRRLIETFKMRDCGGLFFADYKGVRLAVVLAIFFGDRATYFFGGSRPIHRNLMAPYLVHFEVMMQAKARGHAWYDLYGVAPLDDDDHIWTDISGFKRKFGGRDVQYIKAMDFVYDSEGYDAYLESV